MNIFKQIIGQGEDVVVIHGWGCSHEHMQPVVDQLSQQYRVTNIDLPGRGQSEWHSDIHTIHDMADKLLPHMPEKATYIGWSFGGLVSQSIAARHPERVKRFVGLTTTPKFIAENNWIGVPQPGFIAAFSEIKTKGFKEFFQGFYDAEFASFNPKPKSYEILNKILNGMDNVNLDILLNGINICDATDLRNEFKTINCPIDMIFGTKDDSIPLDQIDQIKLLNPKANTHIIPNAGHMPFWTYPEEFNKILKNIL